MEVNRITYKPIAAWPKNTKENKQIVIAKCVAHCRVSLYVTASTLVTLHALLAKPSARVQA